jgi:hypothetical protein
MRELVREAVSGNQTRVDTLDVSYNLWQMKNAYQSLEQATAFPVSSESFWQFGDEEEAEEEKRKRERNYQKLENFRINQLAGLKTRMKNRLDGIDDIYKKYLKAFETMDDSYRKRLDTIYNEKTSSQDKRKNFWESFGNISKAFLKAFAVAAAGAILLALLPAWAPLVMLGGVALVGAGCMVMAEVPKEYVPEWMSGMKDTSDGVSKKLKEYLKRPEGMIEDIGQGLMDTVQTPEGIASVSGTVSGMLLGNWAGKMIKPQVYAQVGKTKENVVKWWKSARNNVRVAGNGGREFQIKPAPKVKDAVFSNEKTSGLNYLDNQLGSMKNNVKINRYESAESVNDWWKVKKGYENPPYTSKTVVQDIHTLSDETFVRVYDGDVSGLKGGWLMKADDIKGLTPKQIQEKFALPAEPIYIGEVNIPKGSNLRVGEVAENFGYKGGGIQFDLKGQYIGDYKEIGKIIDWGK